MHSYSLLSPAKINLYLEIIGDRPNGYHELAMILQSIDLADRIQLRPLSVDKIQIHCDDPQVPTDPTNLAYRAAELMAKEFPEVFQEYGGVEITIQKRIPVAAGLAGGSSNAAAVLVGLDLMWNLGLTQPELQNLGGKLGSDVPFCIAGGTALATGRGDELSPLSSTDNLYVVLAKYRSLGVSTAWAYQTYRQKFHHTYISDPSSLVERRQRVHSGPMVSAIAHHDPAAIAKLLHNDLEKVVLPEYPQVAQLRQEFAKHNILGTMMSGSGPTVFALTISQSQAQEIKEAVRVAIPDPDLHLWVTKFSNTGIRLASD